MQRFNLLFFFFLISAILLLNGCANPVSPTGGPKDSTPPVIIACDPPNFAIRVSEKTFRIDFNEFISLKNPVTEIYISPPLKSQLDTKLKGKSLVIKTEDTLAANTTYSITFGNAITDLTEGNVLKGFNYVFSTGDFVDTLSLKGNLQTAFDHKPQKDVFVELYIDNNDTIPFDSLPFRVAPYYITKTDDQGNFTFHNLRNEHFLLFALADQNGDLIFNQPSEKIAFFDTLAIPFYNPIIKPDTSGKDSVQPAKSDFPSYQLFLYEENDSLQRLLKATFPKEGLALLAFRFPVKNLRLVPLNFDSVTPWFIQEDSPQRDSVRLWITRPNVDSLIAKILINNKIIDTIRLAVTKKESQKKSAGKEKHGVITISNSAAGAGLNQFKNKLTLTFSYPLIRWDFTKVLLISSKDTTHPEMFFPDSLKRQVIVRHNWEEDNNYKIIIPDSVFFGIHNFTHDSVKMEFRTKGENDFGNLILSMKMEKRPGNYIVQLLNEAETTIYEEKTISGSGKMRFDFMPPGKYKIKAIHDRNNNYRWDTGNYKLHIQPEEVIYYQKVVEIRANWDVEETWD